MHSMLLNASKCEEGWSTIGMVEFESWAIVRVSMNLVVFVEELGNKWWDWLGGDDHLNSKNVLDFGVD